MKSLRILGACVVMFVFIGTSIMVFGADKPSGKTEICDGPGPCLIGPKSKTGNFAERIAVNPKVKNTKKVVDLNREPWLVESANLPVNHPALNRERMVWADSLLWVSIQDLMPAIEVEQWVTPLPKNLAGKYILIEVWATWCPACRRSLPYLNFIQEKYKDELVVVAINETEEDDLANMIGSFKMKDVKFSLAIDTGRRLANRMGVYGIPHAILLEPLQGVIVWEGMPTLPRYELDVKTLDKYFTVGQRLRQAGKLPDVSPVKFTLKEATEEQRATRRKHTPKNKKDGAEEPGGPTFVPDKDKTKK